MAKERICRNCIFFHMRNERQLNAKYTVGKWYGGECTFGEYRNVPTNPTDTCENWHDIDEPISWDK